MHIAHARHELSLNDNLLCVWQINCKDGTKRELIHER